MLPRFHTTRRPRLSSVLLTSALVCACASTPADPPAPPLALTLETFAGTVLSGPAQTPAALDVAPWSLDISVARLDQLPSDVGESVNAHAESVVAEHSAAPFQTRSTLARGVRLLATSDALPKAIWRTQQVAALWPGSTVRGQTSYNLLTEDLAQTRWDLFEVNVGRDAGDPERIRFTLSFEGWLFNDPATEEEAPTTPTAVHHREHITLANDDRVAGDVLRIVLPAPRQGFPHSVEVVEVRIERTPDTQRSEFQAALSLGAQQVEATLTRARENSAALESANAFAFQRQSAVEALDRATLKRPAMIFLAKATGADLTGDLVSMADDTALDSLLEALRNEVAEGKSISDNSVEYGWFLECTTYAWLAKFASDPARELPLEFHSLLVRHTGELGRYPDLVLETVQASADQADLRKRLRAENRIFLEDSHPAARVRAYDWLSAVHASPAGYDPLASLAQRREALASLEGDDQ